jgi:chromatin remodeling complex protein RSC6
MMVIPERETMPVVKKTVAPATKTAEPVAAPKKAAAAPAPKAPEPVAASPAAAAPAEDAAPEVSALTKLEEKLAAVAALLKEATAELRAAKKENERMRRIVDKAESKRAKARSNPNGFAKPAKITDDLCDFLAVPRGTLISRTDVTRKINAYIKEHNLNKPENKRFILPDPKLRKILGTKPEEEISYFQLQKYISRSFVKA